MGTGSAVVPGQDIAAWVNALADTDEDQIDVNIVFSSAVPDASDVELTLFVMYSADTS